MDLFFAIGNKINRVAFEKMRLVGAYYKNIARPETLHIIAGYQRALPFNYPGNLCFVVPVQVLVKMRQYIFLQVYGIAGGHGYGKLNHLHLTNITDIFIFPLNFG